MAASNTALVPYRPITTVTTRSTPLGLTRVFTAQTGTAIATELLYRLLWDILQRVLSSLQGFASKRLDALSAYLDQRNQEREALRLEKLAKKEEALGIVEAVEKLESGKRWKHAMGGWAGGAPGAVCPMTGAPVGGPVGPPWWVKSAAQGWTEAEWKVQAMVD
ncbi:uncharacterized protein BDZ99DRAFT_184128 [Mytilinidion resinicola]|uniref:Uncharacterized protein n=1 Tax=Mytilinidion resinicola TaxID=574789 RepID=A0A6A6Z1R8_9PEZI|nr:uncharacterized protein BDZ99DRAFT_184128 [Mytilinidion resinicola]KAF2814748.1 hypothetical protein BDZ99DRAFT_184128 [Mytilinidion resinicola]